MAINLSVACFPKQVLAGTENILLLIKQIPGHRFQIQFDGFSGMQISGSMDLSRK